MYVRIIYIYVCINEEIEYLIKGLLPNSVVFNKPQSHSTSPLRQYTKR